MCECSAAQSCLTLWDPMDCSLPGSSIHGIFQARVQEWVAISFFRGSSRPRDRTRSPALQADALPSEPPAKPNLCICVGFPGGTVVKNPPAKVAVAVSVSESGRSPEEGNGNPLQYSCLGNSMARGAWLATVLGSQELDTTQRLNNNKFRLVVESQKIFII